MSRRSKLRAWVVALVAALAVVVGSIGVAFAAAGDVPPHTKRIDTDGKGTYTLSLDIVGESEKKPNNVNVIVIFDRSGSMTEQRMSAAKAAVNSLAKSLFAYNTLTAPNTVEMALVSFSTHAQTASTTPTSNANTFRSAVNDLSADGGTNWEAALKTANNVDFGDKDQTFVIFVSDGNPTFRDTQGNTRITDNWYYNYDNIYYDQDKVYGLGSDNPDYRNYSPQSMQKCYDHAVDDATALATKVTPGNFFTIGAFGNAARMQDLTDDAGSDSDTNYYRADDTAALNKAIADILAKIEMSGIANAEIADGTTNQVTTTSGKVAELLEVDTDSFKYYKNGTEWADAPKAEFKNGAVEWDLSDEGVLENGVKYTVTFDCYPSQETYDTIAKLKNGDVKYGDLDSEIRKYIVDNGGGSYSLRTNTNATLSYDDTRDDKPQQTVDYTNPGPVATDASTLKVSKKWDGADADVDEMKMTVLMDGDKFHDVTLNKDGNWSGSSFISVGLIKDGQVLRGAEGHDFTFAELDGTQYHWELTSPTVHPMLVDGVLTMLIKEDANHKVPTGAATYTINGATYYVDSSAAGLTATNYRRSNLNLAKVVTGADAPADATFPFTLTVNNSKANDPSSTDTNSDNYVWFSIYDTVAKKTVTDATISGAEGPNSDGYYHAKSGSAISVAMKANWNLRFINLPTGTTYTFAEGDLATGFAFNKAELAAGTDTTFKAGQTSTGTIQATKTSYQVNYTNDYTLTNLEITKVWDDAKNQDGKRLSADELKAKLTLSPAVDGAEPTIKDNGNDTYTITYTGLPRFNNGQEVEYTVAESAIDGYTTTGSPAKDHGTITNKHVPEETEATVKKVWADNNDADKVRPTKIKVSLLKAVGDVVSKVADYDLTAGDDDSWSMTVSGLAKYENGNEIAYSWQEELDKALDGVYSLTHTVVKGNVTTFTNSHVTLDTKTDAILKKTVVSEGNAWETKTFDFTIAAVDGAPMPANSKGSATFTKADTQTIDFGKITYTKAGTYKYTVKETTESGNGWTCDNAEHEVVVTVTDDGSGNLTAAVEPVEIINTYGVKSTTASFPVKKVLSVPEGLKGPASWSYAIEVEAQGDAPEAETMAGTVTNESDTATFGPITYAAPGTYTYKVTETGDIKGVKNDDAASKGKTVTVTVVDNGDGSLTATADSTADEPLTFTNTYGASDATTAPLEAEKTVVNFPIAKLYDEELRTGQFSFKVTDDKTGEVVLSGSNDKNGKVDFGSLTYTEPGTHTYTVTEVKGDATYITYDTETSYKVTITVEDNGEGKLVATVDTHGKTLGFENVYNASNVIELSAKKTLEGRVLEDGQFTFTLTGENDGVSLTAKNDAGGSVTFPEITYDVSKIPDEAWTYAEPADASATDEVATNDEAPAADEGSSDETMTDGTDAAATDDAAINDEAPATDEATADGQGDAEESKPAAKRTAKFVYTISEVNDGNAGYTYDDASFTVTVTVEDDGQGNLTVTDDCPEDLEFVNTYVASGSYTPEVTKMLEGKDLAEGQYSFTLTDEEGNEYTATNAADGTVTFDALSYDQDDAGKTFTYTIKETAGDERFVAYDGHTETLTVTVTDNGDGTLTCEGAYSDGGEFINTYHKPAVGLEVTKTVTSKPSNGKYYRAGETVEYKIVVTNTGEMELYDVKVDDELTGDHWTVDVLAAGGSESFTTSYKVTKADVKAGSVLNVVTAEAENPVDPDKPLKDKDKVEVPTGSEKTPPTPPRKKVIPQTGDETPTGAMAALTVFGAAALTAGTVLQRRKRK